MSYDAGASTASVNPVDHDSVAELKRRQQEAVASYENGLIQGTVPPQSHQLVQHVDSGIRTLDPAKAVQVELPPVYTPA